MNFSTTTIIALFLIATCASPARATVQNDVKLPISSHCLADVEIQAIHLYGVWLAEFENTPQTVLMRLSRHPEWPDNLRGEVDRAGVKTLVAGDVDQGELMLEESTDGQRISATWSGQLTINSCGKNFAGIWTNTITKISTPFVLRKQPSW